MKGIKGITTFIIQNILFFSSYCILLWAIVNFITIKKIMPDNFQYNTIKEIIDFDLIREMLPSIVFIFLTVAIYIMFLIIIGSSIAFAKQRYFSEGGKSSITLYILSIIPPVIVSHYLVDPNQFGSYTITMIISYFAISLFLRITGLRKKINKLLIHSGNKTKYLLIDIVIEMLIFVFLFLLFKMTSLNRFLIDYDINGTLQFSEGLFINSVARILFVLLFNCINFLTIEYISNILSLEIKKSHVKNYFLYEDNPVKRLFYILRSNVALILNKVKLLIVWLITFVLLFEVSYNDWIGLDFSIGKKILNEVNYDEINVRYILTISLVLYSIFFIIFTIIDILSELSQGNSGNTENELTVPSGTKLIHLRDFFGKLFNFRYPVLKIVLAVLVTGVIAVTILYSRVMNIMQHYDFNSSMNVPISNILKYCSTNTNKNLMDEWSKKENKVCIETKGVIFKKYEFINFIIKVENTSEIVLPIVKSNGSAELDSIEECYFLKTNGERFDDSQSYMIAEAKYNNYFYSLSLIKEFDFISYKMERTSKNEIITKVFFPVLFYYILYFVIMLFISFVVCFLSYKIIMNIHISSLNKKWVLKNIYLWARTFILSTPFLLLLYFINNFYENPTNQISYLKITQFQYINSIASYIVICISMLLYIIPGMVDDYYKYFYNILKSDEICYKKTIGMERIIIVDINEKYGYQKVKSVFLETILFLFVLLFFNSFCLNTPIFKDFFGSSMILSFENIFTKIFWAGSEYLNVIVFHVLLFIVIYIILLKLIQAGKKEC